MMKWNQSDTEKLKLLYPDTSSLEIAKILNVSLDRIYNKAFSLGLKKSKQYMDSEHSGRITKLLLKGAEFRFKKGHQPVNKGKSWDEFMSEESRSRSLKTCFKKGHLPNNTMTDGAITIRDDEGRKYKYIRIALAKWVPLHIYLWERQNGKVPEGFIVVFKDKNTMHCELSNLEIITRQENMNRNTWHRYSPELKFAMKKLKQLNRIINGKEQNSGSQGSSFRNNRVA